MGDNEEFLGMGDSPPHQTYLDDVLAGRATVGDIDDYIERWHELPPGASGSKVPLHHYLGLTWGEYGRWVQRPGAAQEIIDAHRR